MARIRSATTRFAGILGVTFLCVGSASAATNFLAPRSGAAFRSNSLLVTHSDGVAWNTDTQNFQTVGVSLGHAQGGQNSFTVYGHNPRGLTVVCMVTLQNDGGGVAGTFPGQTSAGPSFSLVIQTNQPTGNYVYSLSCTLPPSAAGQQEGIIGVKSSSSPNFFTPMSATEFVSTTNSPNIVHSAGGLRRVDRTAPSEKVEASFGHAQGGRNWFDVYSSKSAGGSSNVFCEVLMTPESGGPVLHSNSWDYGECFPHDLTCVMGLGTDVPAGNYFYTVSCRIDQELGAFNLEMFAARPNQSASNFFTPISGVQFVSTSNSTNVVYSTAGEVFSNDTQTTRTVEASLGIAQGGANGFTIYGSAPGLGSVPTCSARVRTLAGSSAWSASGNTSFSNGFFSTFIQTNLTPGNYFYYAHCNLSPSSAAKIIGVKPDH